MNSVIVKTSAVKNSEYVDAAALVVAMSAAFAVVINTF